MNNDSPERGGKQPGDAILECVEVKKSFTVKRKEIPVLKNINLSISRNEVVLITGKSGAGKSTLLGLLAGLEPPTSGSVIFEGQPLEKLPNETLASLRRRKVGIIFQNFNLLPSWTAFENVESALLHAGMSKNDRRTRVEPLLNKLGLGDRLNNLPVELSVGQQQRVAVARTLVNEPALILADEPTGDVDPETGEEIVKMLLAAVSERGATLVIATHGGSFRDIAGKKFHLEEGVLAI